MKQAKRPGPTGRAAVMAALVDASIVLFSQRGIKAVSTRDIGREAGVNAALIFRHFGSKDGLVKATVTHLLEQLKPSVDFAEMPAEQALLSPFAAIRENPAILKVLAHLALENQEGIFRDAPMGVVTEPLAKMRKAQSDGELVDDIDARILLACGTALGLGWHVFHPMLNELMNLQEMPLEEKQAQVDKFWRNAITR